jgi:hypothetical protein
LKISSCVEELEEDFNGDEQVITSLKVVKLFKRSQVSGITVESYKVLDISPDSED